MAAVVGIVRVWRKQVSACMVTGVIYVVAGEWGDGKRGRGEREVAPWRSSRTMILCRVVCIYVITV